MVRKSIMFFVLWVLIISFAILYNLDMELEETDEQMAELDEQEQVVHDDEEEDKEEDDDEEGTHSVSDYSLEGKHRGKDVSEYLNEDYYEEVWINPEKYDTFEDFLVDFETFTGVNVDPVNENFVIWEETEDGKPSYTHFNFDKYRDLYEEDVNRELAILDIYEAYKDWVIYWGADSDYWDRIIFEEEVEHPQTSTLQEIWSVDVYNDDNNVYEYIEDLESASLSQEQDELLSYLYDFTWEYEKANENREDYEKEIELEVKWKAKDWEWNWLEWVTVELLNDDSYYDTTDQEWKFEFSFTKFPFSHIRFRASKEWYADWFNSISVNDYEASYDNKTLRFDFTMLEANEKKSISAETKDEYINSWYYIFEVDYIYYNKYFIPVSWLYFEDWSKYEWNWNLDFYFYQFTRDNREETEDLLDNDTFEPVSWYVGNTMVTFGMPYIQIIDRDTWKELFTKKSEPMILQNQVHHMTELYEDEDELYGEVTEEDMELLVEVSEEEWWYPIDFDFLTDNNMLRWPARWSLDRSAGVRQSVWHRVLDTEWTVELPFYHIDDE